MDGDYELPGFSGVTTMKKKAEPAKRYHQLNLENLSTKNLQQMMDKLEQIVNEVKVLQKGSQGMEPPCNVFRGETDCHVKPRGAYSRPLPLNIDQRRDDLNYHNPVYASRSNIRPGEPEFMPELPSMRRNYMPISTPGMNNSALQCLAIR